MEILGIIVLSIIAVILIMAVIGYFMEKSMINKNNKNQMVDIKDVNTEVVSSVANEDIINQEIISNENAATNANIPDVLNFNDISDAFEEKENQPAEVTGSVNL